MKKTNLIKVTVELECTDSGLDNDKVAEGYLINIVKMHAAEYVTEGKDKKTSERVKIRSAHIYNNGNQVDYTY